jgi:hypothetical protein
MQSLGICASGTLSRAPWTFLLQDALRWIVRTSARLRAGHGEAIAAPALVLPTAAFFPDEFRGDAPGVARLLRRIMTYAPIADDLPIERLDRTLNQAQDLRGNCVGAKPPAAATPTLWPESLVPLLSSLGPRAPQRAS